MVTQEELNTEVEQYASTAEAVYRGNCVSIEMDANPFADRTYLTRRQRAVIHAYQQTPALIEPVISNNVCVIKYFGFELHVKLRGVNTKDNNIIHAILLSPEVYLWKKKIFDLYIHTLSNYELNVDDILLLIDDCKQNLTPQTPEQTRKHINLVIEYYEFLAQIHEECYSQRQKLMNDYSRYTWAQTLGEWLGGTYMRLVLSKNGLCKLVVEGQTRCVPYASRLLNCYYHDLYNLRGLITDRQKVLYAPDIDPDLHRPTKIVREELSYRPRSNQDYSLTPLLAAQMREATSRGSESYGSGSQYQRNASTSQQMRSGRVMPE